MKTATTIPLDKDTSKSNTEPTQRKKPDIPANEAEKEMAWAIRSSINRDGRYAYTVDRLALGYAAGKGMNTYDAKQEVEKIFEKEMQLTPKEYLERHRKERGLENRPSRSR